MVRVLYTTPILRYPSNGGPQLSAETRVKALSKLSELHVVSRVPIRRIGGIGAQQFFEQYCAAFVYSPSTNVTSSNATNKYVRALENLRNQQKDLMLNQDVNYILKYVGEHGIDVVWCHRTEFSFDLISAIKKKRPEIKVVADTNSVYSRFILRELPYQKSFIRKLRIYREGKRKQKEERILSNISDVLTAVSEVDAEYYRSIARLPERIKTFSNVVDVEAYQRAPSPPDDFKKPCIYLAGSFYAHQCPMVDAVRWMIVEILPLVRQEIPAIHLYIIGRGSDKVLSDINDPGITITGELPSVLPYLCHADVALVPLRFESGTRFKILEAGACGIPVVSTTLGAEGLAVTDQKDILIADRPEAFADCIISLVTDRDLALKLASNLRSLVHENYSIASLAEEGRQILEYLTGN